MILKNIGRRESFRGIHHFLRLSLFLLLILPLSAANRLHDYHVSVTQMEYNPSEQLLEISMRFFTDDLEKTLSLNNGNKRFIIKNNDQNSPLIESYLAKNFILSAPDKRAVPFRYVGKEEEQDGTWVYLEIPLKGNLTGYKLQNTALFDTFSDQVNMTNLKYSNGKKTFLFKKSQPVQVF